MSNTHGIRIAYRKDRTHARFTAREGNYSSGLAAECNTNQTMVSPQADANSEAAAEGAAAVDADANGVNASQAV